MNETLIQTLLTGLVAALLVTELVLAITSWVESSALGGSDRMPLLMARSFAMNDHFRAGRVRLSSMRQEQRSLRLPGHRRRVRDAVQRLQPTRLTDAMARCLDCRGSRLRGRSHCQGCARRLVEPLHAAAA